MGKQLRRSVRYAWSLLFMAVLTTAFCCCESEDTSIPIAEKTVLIYMIADNSLSDYAQINIDSMKEGMKQANAGEKVLIYEDTGSENPKLMSLTKYMDGTVKQTLLKTYKQQNSVSPTVMTSIFSDMCSYSPSSHYSLVLWSHGDGWFPGSGNTKAPTTRWFGQDGTNYMDIPDLKTALSSGPHWDSLLFDACFMGGVETDYALRTTADYIIASPSEVMGQGFPYQDIMYLLFGTSETSYIRTATAYYNYYKNQPITLSSYPSATIGCVKCSELDGLAAATKALITAHATDLNTFSPLPVQYLEGYIPHLFYDFGAFVGAFTMQSERSAFECQLQKTVVYKAATPTILSVVSYGNTYVPVKSFSGLNTYIPSVGSVYSGYNSSYHRTEWYTAAGWNATKW